MEAPPAAERLRRWRLILGRDAADGTGASLSAADLAIDNALKALYDAARHPRPSPPRDRLAPRDPRQPPPLPARLPHDHPADADRLRPQAQRPARHHPLRGPERVDGHERRLRRRLWRGVGVIARRANAN